MIVNVIIILSDFSSVHMYTNGFNKIIIIITIIIIIILSDIQRALLCSRVCPLVFLIRLLLIQR
jgi:hypothetical protein